MSKSAKKDPKITIWHPFDFPWFSSFFLMIYHELTYGAIYMSFVLKDSENQVVLGKIINKHQGGKKGKKMVKTWNFGCFFLPFFIINCNFALFIPFLTTLRYGIRSSDEPIWSPEHIASNRLTIE